MKVTGRGMALSEAVRYGARLSSATIRREETTCPVDKGFFARLYAGGNPYGFIVEPGEVKLDIADLR